MAWKEIVLYVADGDQSVTLSKGPRGKDLRMIFKEIDNYGQNFLTYLSSEDAIHLGEELIKFTNEIKK